MTREIKDDQYGLISAARTGFQVFQTAQRRSGRTMRLVERAGDDDVIITTMAKEAQRLRRLLQEHGKKTRVIAAQVEDYPLARLGEVPNGRTTYDHLYVEFRVRNALNGLALDLEREQRSMSKTWPQAPGVDDMDSQPARFIRDKARFGL